MTFTEIFDPGMRHWRRQKELEKVLFVDQKKGARGREPDDLDSGSITIEIAAEPPADPGPTPELG